MKYKLALILNRTNEVPNIQKYLNWFKENTPIEIEFIDTIHTDFDVTTLELGNATYKGVVCGPDIVPKLKTVIPEGKYNAVVLYVGNILNGIRVSTVNVGGISLYADTELVQLRTISDNGKDLNHELFHAFFMKAHKLQISLVDLMDNYLNDSDLNINNVIDTNREMALQLLKPYWDKICTFRSLSTNPKPLSTYKYFSQKEVDKFKLVPKLWEIMDIIRELAGIPIVGTSGLRTIQENKKAGGAINSSHLRGLAFDWLCTHNMKRTKFIKAVLNCGTPVFLEIAKSHIHIDIDSSIHEMGQTIVLGDD